MSYPGPTVRIGARRSRLAVAQAEIVAEPLRRARPGLAVELSPMTTAGDRTTRPLSELGGKGLFTSAIERALSEGQIDLAVHSAKDLPAVMTGGLVIAAVPKRADARDALVWGGQGGVAALPAGARVGTSSLRRRAQLLALRNDLAVLPIRGNVDSRLAKVLAGEDYDAAILALAGLDRLGLAEHPALSVVPLDVQAFVPAAGQGALAVQARADDQAMLALAAAIDDGPSHAALDAERSVVAGLAADCHSCLAVHVAPQASGWLAAGMAARGDGSDMLRLAVRGDSAQQAADTLLEEFLARRVGELLKSPPRIR